MKEAKSNPNNIKDLLLRGYEIVRKLEMASIAFYQQEPDGAQCEECESQSQDESGRCIHLRGCSIGQWLQEVEAAMGVGSGQISLLEPEQAKPSIASEVRRTFDLWIKATGRDPVRTKLTPGRERAVAKCLKAGYTPEQIMEAVRGVQSSDFHMGKHKDRTGRPLDDLTDICRQPERIEQWSALASRPGAAGDDLAAARARSRALAQQRAPQVPQGPRLAPRGAGRRGLQ